MFIGAAAATVVAVALPGDEVTPPPGYVDHTWGIEIKLETRGLPAGERFDMQVTAKDGTVYDAGEFVGVSDKTITCNMSTSVLRADATGFAVVDPEGTEVITGDLTS